MVESHGEALQFVIRRHAHERHARIRPRAEEADLLRAQRRDQGFHALAARFGVILPLDRLRLLNRIRRRIERAAEDVPAIVMGRAERHDQILQLHDRAAASLAHHVFRRIRAGPNHLPRLGRPGDHQIVIIGKDEDVMKARHPAQVLEQFGNRLLLLAQMPDLLDQLGQRNEGQLRILPRLGGGSAARARMPASCSLGSTSRTPTFPSVSINTPGAAPLTPPTTIGCCAIAVAERDRTSAGNNAVKDWKGKGMATLQGVKISRSRPENQLFHESAGDQVRDVLGF